MDVVVAKCFIQTECHKLHQMFAVREYGWIVNCERVGFGPGVVCVVLVPEGK